MVSLSVIISAYNERENIESVLRDLENQTFSDGSIVSHEDYEVLVVDNNSSDRTASISKAFAKKSKLKITVISEPEKGILHARSAGVAYLQSTEKPKYIAFCDTDVHVPRRWIGSIFEGFESKKVDVISYNGSFPKEFWLKVPRLAQRYYEEVGTIFFDRETIDALGYSGKEVRFSRQIYKMFTRAPSGGFYAISFDAYEKARGYQVEYSPDGKQLDGPTWRMYMRLMKNGANLQFMDEPEIQNSARRLLGDPVAFYKIKGFDDLKELADFREIDEKSYERLNSLADRIDFSPTRAYVVQFYILYPAINDPKLIEQNADFFGSLYQNIRQDVNLFWSSGNDKTAFEIFQFAEEMRVKYVDDILTSAVSMVEV